MVAGEEWWGTTVLSWMNLSWKEIWQYRPRCSLMNIFKCCFRCFYCPLRCICGTVQQRSSYATFSRLAIVTFLLFFLTTVVFNLGILIAKPYRSIPSGNMTNSSSNSGATKLNCSAKNATDQYPNYEIVLNSYTILYMWLGIFGVFYLIYCARKDGFVCEREAMMETIYYRAGLYIFGCLSIGYSLCKLTNFVTCHENCCCTTANRAVETSLQLTTTIFITAQILFLNSYYRIQLSIESPCVQFILAHVVGVNLSLWFWTLCLEVGNPLEEKCDEYPIPVKNAANIFFPVLVEYLLLAASMFYELWSKLKKPTTEDEVIFQSLLQDRARLPDQAPRNNPRGRRPLRLPAWGGSCSLVFGLFVGLLFVVLVLASHFVGDHNNGFYQIFVWGTCVVFVMQIIFCYITLVCVQTQRGWERITVDYDDALLYFSLAGILLWEGFHFYAAVARCKLSAACPHVYELFVDLLGPVEYVIQTVTLVTVRRHASASDRNASWISYCALFLLATNFAHWIQDSFFIVNSSLIKPGEEHYGALDSFIPLAFILNPLIVFFRFHSASCFFQIWSTFSQHLRRDR